MATLAVTNTLSNGQTSDASLWNTNYSDIVTWINNRYNGTDTWSYMKVSSTNSNPVNIASSASTTEFSLDNTATDGDPMITFKLSGSRAYTLGIDDSDSDAFIGATTGITTNQWMRVTSTGGQIKFVNGMLTLDTASGNLALFQYDSNIGNSLTIRNDNTTSPTATACSLALKNLSDSISGSIILTKYANGHSGTSSSGLSLSNAFKIGTAGDNISKWIIDLGTPSSDALYIEVGSNVKTVFSAARGGWLVSDGTKTLVTIGFKDDDDTGFFRQGSGSIGVSANDNEVARFDVSAVAGNTRFMVYDVDNATLERVTVGAADSGGSGFKVLRIPN